MRTSMEATFVRVTHGLIRRRLVMILICLLVAIAMLIGRLGYVQTVMAPWLNGQALNQANRTIKISPLRGSIYDVNDKPLAYTQSAPSILAVPVQVLDKEATADKLASILHANRDTILRQLQRKQKDVYIKAGRKMTDAEATQVQTANLPGIYITEDGIRAYPYGSLAAQVLGITGSENQGITGVEAKYNSVLKGKSGEITFLSNAAGQKLPGQGEGYVPAQPGEDVRLTIDAQIQQFVEREIEKAVAQYNPDHVTAIVENPKTGAILAMANYPSFDPAHWQDYPQANYNRNLAIWQTFEPGSTFKIVTLSAALQENKVNLSDKFYDPGYYEVAGRRVKCWKAGGHGSETFLNVVENSCNPGFIALGERLGKQTLFDYIKKFGFGTKTGIDLPGEGNGILFKLNRVGPLELATTAFGQGVSVTPIQQVMAMGAIANGGLLLKPHVVDAYLDHDTHQVTYQAKTQVVRRVVSPQVATQVRNALESVVAQGSGGNAYLDGYRVAGKTGTAQVAQNGRYASGHYIVSFIGMAPANDPKLVAYIAIDHPRAPVIFGGVIAAPIVGQILSDSLSYLGVPKQTAGLPKKWKYGEPVYTSVPNFVGMTVGDASRAAIQSGSQLSVKVVGTGKYVVKQAPEAGVKVTEGSSIRLYLGNTPPTGTLPQKPAS